VEVPEQTCCGALAYHAGEVDIARKLARENIALFGFSQTPIVVTSAGCGAMLKHYGHLLADDSQFASRAESFSNRVVDLSEFLAHHQFGRPAKPLAESTTYHAACHLAHAQNVRAQPQLLLKTIAELPGSAPLVPLPESEHCCGSAGIYNLFNTELSLEVLSQARNLPVKVKHLAQLLDEAYD
jgi:glycolate oxidase iron-sulfur subunit